MRLPESQRAIYLLGPERIELREEPLVPPGEGEILLRIEAATTCGTDVKVFRRGGHPQMLQTPCRFGHEVAGTLAAVGRGVEAWSVGQRVVVANSAPCGACPYCAAGRENLCRDLAYLNGAFGEYLLLPPRFVERSTYEIPAGLPAPVAALTEPLACVLHGEEACRLDRPSDVLVLGGGPIGLLFVAVLAAAGHRVVLADPNRPRLAMATKLGAAATFEIVDREGDGEALRQTAEDALGFDLTVDATGSPAGWRQVMAAVRPGGTVNLFGGCAPGTTVPLDTHRVHYSELTVLGVYHHRPATVARALALLAAGEIDAGPLLSGELPLTQTEEALRSMIRREALKVVVRPH